MGLRQLSQVSKLPSRDLFETLIGKKTVEDCFPNIMRGNIGNIGEDPYEGLFGVWDDPAGLVYEGKTKRGADLSDAIDISSLFEIADNKKPEISQEMFHDFGTHLLLTI